jgi:hypothetical protein
LRRAVELGVNFVVKRHFAGYWLRGHRVRVAHVGDRLDTGIGAEFADHGVNVDVCERRSELLEPITATAHDHRVRPVGAEPPSRSPADAGGGAGGERRP